jgi:alpha-1,2-mannosyltransferase
MASAAPRISSALLRRGLLVAALGLGLLLSIWRVSDDVEKHLRVRIGSGGFSDVRIFLEIAQRVHEGGRIYATEESGYFDPGSAVYKYPPTYLACLYPLRDLRWRRVVSILFRVNGALLLLAFGLVLVATRPSLPRALLMAIVFVNWSPFWESVAGMQLELAMLALLAAAAALAARGRYLGAGAGLGAAAALKVYPGALAAYFLLLRRWRAAPGLAVGALLPLLGAALVLGFDPLVEYIRIFPRLGGVNLSTDNLGIPGLAARLAVLACGALVAVVALTLRKARAGAFRLGEDPRRELLGLGACVCALLLILPTSWPDYQTLLILPLLLAFAWVEPPARRPWEWGLLLAAAVAGGIQLGFRTVMLHPHLMPYLRAWIPFAVLAVTLLQARRLGAGASPARNDGPPGRFAPGGPA